MQTILLVDDERNVHYSLQRALGQAFRIVSAYSGEDALRQVASEVPQVVLLDNKLPGMSGLETLQRLKTLLPDLPVILLTAYGSTETTITAMKLGAYDYLLKPVDIPTLKSLLSKVLQLETWLGQVEPAAEAERDAVDSLVGYSPAMPDRYKMIGRVAPTGKRAFWL